MGNNLGPQTIIVAIIVMECGEEVKLHLITLTLPFLEKFILEIYYEALAFIFQATLPCMIVQSPDL